MQIGKGRSGVETNRPTKLSKKDVCCEAGKKKRRGESGEARKESNKMNG